jgi:hypothetical protein
VLAAVGADGVDEALQTIAVEDIGEDRAQHPVRGHVGVLEQPNGPDAGLRRGRVDLDTAGPTGGERARSIRALLRRAWRAPAPRGAGCPRCAGRAGRAAYVEDPNADADAGHPLDPDRWPEERQYRRNNPHEALVALGRRRGEVLTLLRSLSSTD